MSADPASESKHKLVAEALRKDIGGMIPGARLPSQPKLAARFGVSRDTVQNALKELQEEGLVSANRGSGTFVTGQPGAQQDSLEVLDEVLDEVLSHPQITIDYYGFTAETLAVRLLPRLYEMRFSSGPLPESLTIRMVLPEPLARLGIPQVVDDPGDDRPLHRLSGLARLQVESIENALRLFRGEDEGMRTSCTVRHLPVTPLHKLYVFNGSSAWLGLYGVYRNKVRLGEDEEQTEIFDVRGVNAPMSEFDVGVAQQWFEDLWSGPANHFTLDSWLSED